MCSNTSLSQKTFLAGIYWMERQCITAIAFATTTDRKTSNFGLDPSQPASASVMPSPGPTRSSSATRTMAHLQRPSRSRVRAVGGGHPQSDRPCSLEEGNVPGRDALHTFVHSRLHSLNESIRHSAPVLARLKGTNPRLLLAYHIAG